MRILVVGGGGREHALGWKIRRDRPEAQLYAAPGNGGIGTLATLAPIKANDVQGICAWAIRERPDLVVVGPDDPLALGLVDALESVGIRAFGPRAAAARIESSKAWAAELLEAYEIPSPTAAVFADPDQADRYVDQGSGRLVVKADGLALGKGVFVCDRRAEAHAAIDRIGRRREFGAAGERLVIQERLSGRELSVFALCDGTHCRLMGAARDYKRAYDGDRGPNTGGMGAYTPVSDATPALLMRIEREILGPTLQALRAEGCPFTGFLYAGLMLTPAGPKVLEFNSRLGDPEAQVILPTLEFDLVDAMLAALDGNLARVTAPPARSAAVCVVVASDGYPGSYATGYAIDGLDQIADGALLFHAGTIRKDGAWRTAGGRVLSAVGLGASVAQARERAYALATTVTFTGARYRTDIGMIECREEAVA